RYATRARAPGSWKRRRTTAIRPSRPPRWRPGAAVQSDHVSCPTKRMDREGGSSEERSGDERRLAAPIEFGADVITLHHADGAVFYAAPSVTHILGYAIDEWV